MYATDLIDQAKVIYYLERQETAVVDGYELARWKFVAKCLAVKPLLARKRAGDRIVRVDLVSGKREIIV